jgi:hypothetical protein
MRRHQTGRILLLILVAAMLAIFVLASALEMLPAPPGAPTPTASWPLDRPEGRPRM